jgi:tetratricopeptide (TPR) repeat protein
VALALGRLYRKTERYEEGVALLRERLRALAPSSERALGLSLTLAEVMAEEGGDARGALQVIEAASEHHEGDVRLRDRSVALCRTLREPAALVEALQARGEPDDLLEAARLLHREVGDGARALELYSRVLAEAKLHSDQEAHARRLAAALEGLVKLRVEDGDIAGAMDFMDKQLAEVEGPTIRALLLAEMGRITYQSTGDVAAARERFDAALREDPQHAQAKLGLARILVLADALHEAEGHLTAAVDALALAGQQTELVEALVILAEVLERTDRSGEAYRRLTAALRHDPDNLEIRAAVVRNRHGAQRHRDAITAVEQIEQRLAEHPAAPEQRRLVSDTFVLAARSEEASKNPDGAYARYRRAAEIDPDNPAALEPLLPLCHEHGAWVEAAGHTLALARGTESRELRAQRFVDAALLYFDAAATVADTHDPDAPQTPESLRQSALLAMRSGLELAEGYEEPILERGALEAAFRHAAPRDAVAGLRILEQLLRHPEIPEPRQHDLLLEGARLALSAGERLELAERYAFKARQLVPGSSAAVLAHAEVLQAADRVEEIEPLVESFFVARRDEGDDAEERRHRITLLLRLAELQGSHPEKAVGSLERAAALAGDALPASERRRLAELYGQLGRRDDAAMDNHRRLLEQEPLFVPSLAALAAHHAEAGELDHAFALWSLVSLVEPAHPQAQAFLLDHRMVGEPPEGPVSDSWLEDLRPPPLSDAGVGEVLLQLWEGGASLLSEHLPKLEIPADARVSPLGEGLVCQAWAELLKRLGQGKVALVDTMGLPDEHEAERPDGSRDGGFFHVRCQNPPVILADGRAFHTDDPDEVRFALGRAIYFTRPEAVFARGLRRVVLAQLLSATFGAFHPRHARRRHHARGEDDDFAGRLGQDLTRKLPVKVARRLATVLKTYEDEPFDTRTWRAWVRCCGNRVGLALCGQLPAALRVLNDGDIEPIGDELREWAAHDGDVRDLLAFAASPAYVRARRELGATVLLTVDDDE